MLGSKSMKNTMTFSEVADLAGAHTPRELFGADSPHPFLAFELSGSTEIGSWLFDLPCPVIGIGSGALASFCDVVLDDEKKLPILAKNIDTNPIAAAVLVQHLRISQSLPKTDALTAESFAYGTLQTGKEFLRWKDSYSGARALPLPEDPLIIERTGSQLSLTLSHPESHNAIGTLMRDALCEALDMAIMDTSIETVILSGSERVFSVGGAVEEFGEVTDSATAHWIRSLRLPAWRLARLKSKLQVIVRGGAIGAGVEMAAFADELIASPKAWFQLPELKYGLIPGAGGTASLPARIGRQKTAYLALSMDKISAETALSWGLVDRIIN